MTAPFRSALAAAAMLGAMLVPQTRADEPEDQLDRLIARFKTAKQKADSDAEKAFDKALTTAKTSNKIKETVRQEFIDKAFKAKQRFGEDGTWSDEPLLGLRDDEFEYAKKLADEFAPVQNEYERVLKKYRQDGDEASTERLLASREVLFTEAFPGRKGFRAGSVWSGNVMGAKGRRSTMVFRVTSVKQSVIEAVVAMNPQNRGHPVFEVNGTLVGNFVDVLKTKQVQGGGSPARLRGYLSVNRLFLLGTWGSVALERRPDPKKK